MRQIIFNLDESDKTLIFSNFYVVQGENLATELVFNLSPEFQGYKYLIEFQNNSKTPVITPELLAINNVVKYIVTNAVTTQAGILKIQFQAYDDSGKLIKSIITNLKVAESIQGVTEIMPEAYVPWYLQAVEQANIATAKAEEAAQSATNAYESEVAAKESEGKAKNSENNAKISEDNTVGSEGRVGIMYNDILNNYNTSEHLISSMPHQAKDLQNTKTFRFGLQMSADGQPQIKFEEVL